jgi:predicted ATPase
VDIAATETIETPKEELTTGSIFAGRYKILEELGKGGMGRVYRAFDNKVEEEIAFKLIKPEIADNKKTIKRFRNELKLARKITHKNVCRMFDLHEEGKTPFITMEYVRGESLKAFIQKQGMLSEEKTIDIAQQICSGLSEAHELGVVHRDLKPQNIMIDEEGNAKIMDFGIARSIEAKGVTQTGMMIGTPDYMSPEQAEGKEADQRSDIYSLGIILYEMATGRLPFEGNTALSVALKHKTEMPADPRELNDKLSDDLSSVILKCLEKSPEARFQSVEELLSELRNIEEGLPLTTSVRKARVPEFLPEGAEDIEIERPVFVAREEELSKLGEFFDQALSGKGHAVFVKGEAGSGKTALVQEFARRAQEFHSELIVAGGNCNAHTGIGDPYLPFREVLALLTGDVEGRWKAGSISTDNARRLWHCLPILAQSLVQSGPELIDTFVAGRELLDRARVYSREALEWLRNLRQLVERKVALPVDSSLQQSILFRQFARVLETLAETKPVLLILDDLQWVDSGSASLLTQLIKQIQSSQMLILGLFRPEEVALDRDGERHPLKPIINECKTRFGDIEVEVGRTGAQEFVNAYLDTEPNKFSSSFRDSFLKHTEGHSLFTTEVFRGLKDQGALVQDSDGRWKESEIAWEKLPTRVEAMIGERIERMPNNIMEILKVGSIQGEYFTGEVLAGVLKADEREMIRMLSGELDKRYQLVSAQGIKHEGGQRISQYRFRHILFQKYLYNSMDKVERAHLHEDVGNVLENLYGEQAGEISGQLARHFQEAGLTEKAISYLQQAASKAVRLSANNEAITHFRKALELLGTLPDTQERIGLELTLQLGLAAPLSTMKGWAVPEVFMACSRARKLCELIGETPQLSQALWFLSTYYGIQAEYKTAIDLGKKAWISAERNQDPLRIAIARWQLAWLLTVVGDFSEARDHAKHMIDFYDRKRHGTLGFSYTLDPGVACLGFAAWSSWFMGHPDESLKYLQKAIALARDLDHPISLVHALYLSVISHFLRWDRKAFEANVDELVRLSTKKGLALYQGIGSFYQGYIESKGVKIREGITKMQQAMITLESIGVRTQRSTLLAMWADAYRYLGKADEGLRMISEAHIFVQERSEYSWEAEIHRLKGELLLMKNGAEEEAEASFHRAIEVAQKQQANSWELRATMSLARLWKKQGKKKEAHKKLADIYDWFTEGFNTQDLKDAKALLRELSKEN